LDNMNHRDHRVHRKSRRFLGGLRGLCVERRCHATGWAPLMATSWP